MRSASIFFLVLTSSITPGAIACDKSNAVQLRDSLIGMGRAEPLAFRWSASTKSMPDQMRATLMQSYATADACLNGKPRKINFFVGAKPIGFVDVDGFFVPLDSAYDLPPRPGFRAWFNAHVK